MKNNKSSWKKNILVTTATLAAVTGGTVIANQTIHADTVNTNSTAAQPATSQSTNLASQQSASRQSYASAQAQSSQANNTYSQALTKQSAAQSAEQSAQSANTSAQSAVNSVSAAVNSDQAGVNSAQSAYDQFLASAARQSAALHSAQVAVNSASAANVHAQSALTSAQNTASQAQSRDQSATTAQSSAQTEYNNAQSAASSASAAISGAQLNVTNAQNHSAALTSAQNGVNSAQAQLTSAQAQLTVATAAQAARRTGSNSLYTNETYDRNAKILSDDDVFAIAPDDGNTQKAIADGFNEPEFENAAHQLHKENVYHHDPAAQKVIVHWNNDGTLDDATNAYATEYALALLNEVRTAVGVPLMTATVGMQKIEKDILKNYTRDHWDMWKQFHDLKALDDPAKPWGLYGNGGFSENWGGVITDPEASDATMKVGYPNETVTLDDVQESIYENLNDMLFDDGADYTDDGVLYQNNHWGHTTNFLTTKTLDMAVGFRWIPGNNNNLGGYDAGWHYNFAPNATQAPSEYWVPYNWKPNSPYLSAENQQQLPTVDPAHGQHTSPMTVADAQALVNTAHQNLTNAQHNLTDVQHNTMSLSQAQAQLTTAQHNLTAAQARLNNAGTALTNTTNAKRAADSQLKTANYTLGNAQIDAHNTAIALHNAQLDLDDITPNSVSRDQLDAAQTALIRAQQQLSRDQAALTAAQNTAKTTAATLAHRQAQLQAAQHNVDRAAQLVKSTAEHLAQAKAHLITDSSIYGKSATVKNVSLTAGSTLPAPVLVNPTEDNPLSNPATADLYQMASSSSLPLPTGTKAAWTDVTAANHDAATVGTYQLPALITFPDGSTITKNATLTVTAAATSQTPANNHGKTNQTPANNHDKTDQTPANNHGKTDQTPANNTGSKTDQKSATSNQANNSTASHSAANADNHGQGTVNFSTENNTNGTVKTTGTTTNADQANAAESNTDAYLTRENNINRLPQTSNANEWGLVALGLASVSLMLGMKVKRQN